MDKEREKWIARADDYKRKHGTEMVVIIRHGTYENWPLSVFEKSSISKEIGPIHRTDKEITPKEEPPKMTVTEYAAQVYERSCYEKL